MIARFLVFVAALASASASLAADNIKVAIGSGGNLEAWIAEIGVRGGLFEKQGLKPEIFYTAGGGETLQAVLSGSAPFGLTIGASGAIGAYAKGAPLRIIGASSTGSANFWYVRPDSPIHTMRDIAGHTLAYSSVGSGTHIVALLVRGSGIDAKLVATGATPATYTQVLTGQVDVGFFFPEFGQEPVASGKARVVFRDNDFEHIRTQALRVLTMHASTPPDVAARFMRAYSDSFNWIYSDDPKPLEIYAQLAKVDIASARRLRDEYYSRDILSVAKVRGIDTIMKDAVDGKFISAPLTKAQIDELIIPSARE